MMQVKKARESGKSGQLESGKADLAFHQILNKLINLPQNPYKFIRLCVYSTIL